MSKGIKDRFELVKKEGRCAFIPYITAGDYPLYETVELVNTLIKGGADIIEIGIPYSDPLADGPVLQNAAHRSLQRGTKLKDIFLTVEKVRQKFDIPLVFLVYYNTIFNYGVVEFVKKCNKIGVDGLIIPDIPLEESQEIYPIIKSFGLSPIPLVSPTSRERINDIITNGDGFVYCISSLGVTGVRNKFSEDIINFLNEVREVSNIPVAIGFGIGSPDIAKYFRPYVDGVIVGSALVDFINNSNGNLKEIELYIKKFTDTLR